MGKTITMRTRAMRATGVQETSGCKFFLVPLLSFLVGAWALGLGVGQAQRGAGGAVTSFLQSAQPLLMVPPVFVKVLQFFISKFFIKLYYNFWHIVQLLIYILLNCMGIVWNCTENMTIFM